MNDIFIQRYLVNRTTPVISISSNQPKEDGKVEQGTVVRGKLKNVKAKVKGSVRLLTLLQIGDNRYINSKYVVLEELRGVDASVESTVKTGVPSKKPNPLLIVLPFAGLGLGLFFAHRNRSYGTKKASTTAYIGFAALGLFVASLPIMIWKYKQSQAQFDVVTDKAATKQQDKSLTDRAYESLLKLAAKAGKKPKLNKDDFHSQFTNLTTKEKEAFVYIAEESLKISVSNSQMFAKSITQINNSAIEKYGLDTIQSLAKKTNLS